MPAFAIEGGLLLALVRGLWVAALLSVFGTLAFWVTVAPRALARAPDAARVLVDRSLHRLTWAGLAAAGLLLLAWAVLQSAEIAGASGLRDIATAVAEVLPDTVFGQLALLQLAGLVATGLALRWSRWAAAGFAAVTTALQAGHGHALAMADGPSLLLVSSVLHLLAAGAWLGGLAPLLAVVRVAPPRVGAMAARWFSPLGKWCIALLCGSAVIQFWQLIGGLPGLVGTAYGWLAIVKLVLLSALLVFAAVNRYQFAPRLLAADPDAARRVLLRSIAVQTGVGVMAVLAAATLGSLPPAIHEQPLWPFAVRPSLVVLGDPDLRAEVMQGVAGVLLGIALLLVGAALYRRRVLALAGLAIGLGVGGAAASHLDLLFVPAYPTSYYHSPTGFTASSVAEGASVFPQHCASCHGADGRGDGPAAKGMADPPADLTAEHLWAHDDGELFWWLSYGIEGPEGGLAMPGFAGQLSADDRWALIDYIRAHNAGAAFHDAGRWPVPVQAPSFAVTCPGSDAATTADLRGKALHIVVLASWSAPPLGVDGAVTVLLAPGGQPASVTDCFTADPAAWRAYAFILGVSEQQLAGAQFLVDPNGWLRAAQRPGEAVMRWADPALLLADVEAICRHPIASVSVGHVHH